MTDTTALASDLAAAVERGEAPAVAALLARLRATGWTPAVEAGAPTLLHRALLGPMPGALAVAELLARNGVALDARGPGGATPLHHAIVEGRDDAAGWLVDRGARIDQRDDAGRTPLELAASERGRQPVARAALVQRLLALGADVGARDARGGTLLHVAVRQQAPDVVAALLSRGLDVAATDADGATPLHALAERPTISPEEPAAILDALLAHGAVLDAPDAKGATALHLATQRDTTIVAGLLLDRGADLAARTSDGTTPLLAAVEHEEMLALLLARGADRTAARSDGRTALHQAAATGRPETLRLLLDAGLAVDARDAAGDTPLHLAVQGEDALARVEMLLAAGADARSRNTAGLTPLHAAALAGAAPIVDRLIAAGADVNARTTAECAWPDAGTLPANATPLDLVEMQPDQQGPEGDAHRALIASLRRHGGTRAASGLLGRVKRLFGKS
jgi:uncharacterized protein